MRSREKSRKLAVVLIIGIVIIVAAEGFITANIGYWDFIRVLEKQYNDTAYEVAETARGYLPVDKLQTYTETLEKDDEYNEVEKRLDELVNAASCNFIYVAKIDRSNLLKTTYIFDSLNDDLPFERYPLGCSAEDMDPKYLEDIELVLNGGKSTKYAYSYGESGAHTTAALSVADSAGKIVAMVFVEKPMTALENAKREYIRDISISAGVIIVIVIILFTEALSSFVIRPLNEITDEARRFAEDHTESESEFKAMTNRYEIGVLARSIKKMENDIHEYYDNLTRVMAEKERIGTELSIATQIQADMLPSIFPAFPGRDEFDIYASMKPAKEVGGDFYDFFMIDDDHLGLVMADVSGKGVPAALFMVIAKTLIKNRLLMGDSPSEVLKNVNNQLCEVNETELFVTVWLAVLEISTGKGVAANAGHEHPALCRKNGRYELVIYRHSPAVATVEGIRFRQHEFQLFPGDSLFVYTDGVTEATDGEDRLFGPDRMISALNSAPESSPMEQIQNVRQAVDAFVGDTPQFDDITMLCFHYYGPHQEKRSEMTVEASIDKLREVLAFVDERLEGLDCPIRTQMQIDVAVEEIFVNIANYAYSPDTGDATISLEADPETRAVSIVLKDRGIPFNPLEVPAPDTTLSAEKRQIGGLGIFMVRESMDDVSYEYRDGQNILTLRKKL